MLEGVTYQSKKRFAASLYALEVKSRFIDQNHADGYYKEFGEELNANAAGNTITVGTGAFLVQGRMNVVTESERIVVSAAHAGKKGMVVAHINTFQPDTGEYCVLQALFDASVSAIEARLKRENTYAADSDTMNRVYELPLFTFDVGGEGTVLNLEKVIKPIEDYAAVKALYDEILAQYKAHNEELKNIKDEIVVRQGTIVTSGGKNLVTFNADLKANLTKVSEIEKRLDILGFKSGNITSTVCNISEKTYIHRQGNYVIGKIFLKVNFDKFIISGEIDGKTYCTLNYPIRIPYDFFPRNETEFFGIYEKENMVIKMILKSNGGNTMDFSIMTRDYNSFKGKELEMVFSFGYEAEPL